ncbi:MAG: hypothetical protein ACRDHL_12045 [Candidatus Promineifilaceae bacterium]
MTPDVLADCDFYLCPVCFQASALAGRHHDHDMLHCRALPAGHGLLKPPLDEQGELKSRAPSWYLVAFWRQAGSQGAWLRQFDLES